VKFATKLIGLRHHPPRIDNVRRV